MKNTLLKSVIISAAVVTMMIAAGTVVESSHAAMGDRSVAGSTAISLNGTVIVPEGKEVKLNFGMRTEYPAYYYVRIKPSKTGFIKFQSDFNTKTALLNQKKQVISRGENDYDDILNWGSTYSYLKTISYGVKKGKVYYIRLNGGPSVRDNYQLPYVGSVKWTNKKVKAAKAGKSQKKAVTIKRGKKIKGLFVGGDKKAKWYKFKSRSKSPKIYLKSKNTCGGFIAEARYKGYSMWLEGRVNAYRHDKGYTKSTTCDAYRKNSTYYVRVFRDKMTSGEYTLWWK